MSSEAEKIIEDNAGIKVNLTESLANMVVERFIGSLDETVLKNTFEEMSKDYVDNYDPSRVKLKVEIKRSNWGSSYDESYLGKRIRETLADKYTNLILEEADKYMETTEFKEALSQMVAEVIAYAVEGYKKDMIERLKERLVGNAYSFSISENNESIDDKIRNAIIQAKNGNYY